VFLAAALASASAPVLAQDAVDPLARIGHIVVIFEENRSFDNLFGDFPRGQRPQQRGRCGSSDRARWQSVRLFAAGHQHQR
jgi:phospholipase C